MESEEQGVANGSGLISTTPNRPSAPAPQKAPNKKSIQHSLPTQLKSHSAPTVVESRRVAPVVAAKAPQTQPQARPVSQVTRVAPHAAVPGIEIKVNRRESHAPLQASEKGAYDAVPSDQADSLVRRLRLVEALIRRHSRAYDYRIHTIKELETVLADLDRSVRPAPIPVQYPAQPAPQSGPAEKRPAQFPIEGTQPVAPAQAQPQTQADQLPPPPAAAVATPAPSTSDPETDIAPIEE